MDNFLINDSSIIENYSIIEVQVCTAGDILFNKRNCLEVITNLAKERSQEHRNFLLLFILAMNSLFNLINFRVFTRKILFDQYIILYNKYID